MDTYPIFNMFKPTPLLALMGLGLLASCSQTKESAPEIATYSIDQFFNNEAIGGGSFSEDEGQLLFSSNRTGIYNVYAMNLATKEVTALTSSTGDSYFGIGFVPGMEGAFMYSADQGGNENSHIYLQKGDGTVTDLTPGETEKASFNGWAPDKKGFYFTSNVRDARYFDLYKMDLATLKPTLLFENNEGLSIANISWDESSLALTKTVTRDESMIYLVDMKTKERTQVSDPSAVSSNSPSYFSRDNASLYYTTDQGEEFSYLVRYDIASGNREVVMAPEWDVMYAYGSETDKYRVVGINEDGKTKLILSDANGQEVAMPEIPDGSVVSIAIAESEKLARLTVGSSKASSNLYLYNFETKKLEKLTNTLNEEIDPTHLVSAEVVRYPSFDGLEIPAIYYKPLTADADNKVPALVWVHGGPGGQSRVGFNPLIQFLVNHGYAVLAVNNRGSSGYGKSFQRGDDRNHGEKDLQDCIYGKNWLASQDYINADQIGIIGGSYGGYMTMAAMTFTPEEFKVGVNLFGVTNWLRTLKSIPPYWESFRASLYQEMGDPHTEDSVRLYENSPLFHASKVVNPVMVLQGANDPRVLQVESDEIVEAVKANGVPVEYIIFPDEGHGFVKKENQIRGYQGILDFLNTHLKKS